MSLLENGKKIIRDLGIRPIGENSYDGNTPEEKVITEIQALINRISIPGKELSYKDYSKRWNPATSVDEISPVITDYIHCAYSRNKMSDASRNLEDISVVLYKPLRTFSWVMDISVSEVTRLGDGARYFDQDSRTWNFVQKKGFYPYRTHLMIRQKK